jgi:hypothetical protein
MPYDQPPSFSKSGSTHSFRNESDPEWRGLIEGDSQELRYKVDAWKTEAEIYVVGASLHTDRDTNEPTEGRNEGRRRCYPIDDRFHQLDQLDSSKGVSDTSKFEKLWKPVIETSDSLGSTIIPNAQVSGMTLRLCMSN